MADNKIKTQSIVIQYMNNYLENIQFTKTRTTMEYLGIKIQDSHEENLETL